MSSLLELSDVSSGYGRAAVLKGVSLTVGTGEIVALVGANGAGKTTLLNTIMGIVPLSSGDVSFDGRSIARLPTAAIVQAGMAIVPERRRLFGTMTVEENLRMGAYLSSDRASISALLEEQFSTFPILRERRAQPAQTMSGGEQQMLAIGRAMMSKPRLLLLDEPSLGLAPLMVERIMAQIQALQRAGGTVLIVEQNARVALGISDRGYVVENGQIVKTGAAAALLADPAVQDAYLGGQGAIHQVVENRIRAEKLKVLGR